MTDLHLKTPQMFDTHDLPYYKFTQVSHPQWGTVPHLVTLCLMRLFSKYQVRNLKIYSI